MDREHYLAKISEFLRPGREADIEKLQRWFDTGEQFVIAVEIDVFVRVHPRMQVGLTPEQEVTPIDPAAGYLVFEAKSPELAKGLKDYLVQMNFDWKK